MRAAAFLGLALLAACAKSNVTAQAPSPAPSVDTFVAVYKVLRPSVVLFTMLAPSDDPKRKGAYDDAYGSGFVVESGSWGSRFLTAEHVIDGARRLRVTIGNRRTLAARVIASDSDADLAVVEADEKNLPPVRLGLSRSVDPGIQIGVAGYPIPDAFQDEGLGMATSVFEGRLSSIRHDALELDIPVIPGESGGPVFDAHTGDIIGIAESRFDEEHAIGFAIPIEDAERFLAAHPRRTALTGAVTAGPTGR
ncbi:MAG TPA: serine protease [Candidatus Baltobacteraceae bacterium]